MSTEDSKPEAEAAARPEARHPYQAPTLKRLGSIRELTWGGGSFFEGLNSGMGMGMMGMGMGMGMG